MQAWELLATFGGQSGGEDVRYDITEPATIVVSHPPQFHLIDGTIMDVSRSGLRIRPSKAIHRGTDLHVQLTNAVVFGNVRNCRPSGEGSVVQGSAASESSASVARPEIEVLLVEDNPGDVKLTRLMLEDTGVPHHLSVVMDGEEALKRLLDPGQPKPGLMLLDLNLPRVSGFEVLERVKNEQALHCVVVAVLSSSAADLDQRRTGELGARAYFQKPQDFEHYKDLGARVRALMTQLAH